MDGKQFGSPIEIGGYLSYRTVYDCFKRIVATKSVPPRPAFTTCGTPMQCWPSRAGMTSRQCRKIWDTQRRPLRWMSTAMSPTRCGRTAPTAWSRSFRACRRVNFLTRNKGKNKGKPHFSKKNPLKPCGSRAYLVDDTGLEPVTSRTSSGCSTS